MRRRSFLLAGTGVIVAAGATACTVDPPTPSASATPEPDDLLVPRPTAVFRSAWATDPYHLGSLSYLTVGATAETRAVLAAPVIDRVFLAGEATSVDAPATVDGAIASGERAAADVITVGSDGERVAVIGAGIAGATAARRLLDAGFRVTVLEASDRTGGRIHSTGDDDWGVPVELGADRFAAGGATDSALRDLDVETGLISTNDSADGTPADGLDAGSAGGAEYRSADGTRLEPSAVGTSTIEAAAASLAGSPNDISFAAAIRQVQLTSGTPSPVAPEGSEPPPPTDDDWVDAAVDEAIRIPYGAEPTDLSARSGLADGPREGDSRAVTALSQLVDDALDGVDVWPSNVVSELAYDADGVSIRIATGESLQVDRVVVTVSLGVLKSGDIRFSPALPLEHSVAIAGLGMGAAEVVWLRFETTFWRSDATSWTTVGSDLDITRWRNLEPATGVPVLVGYVGGSDAVAFAGMDDDEIVERARRSLEPYLGQ